jgi:hypothetical protein
MMADEPTATGRIDTANVRRLTLHCRRCNNEFGEFLAPNKIRLGGMVIRQRIAGYCVVCQRRWLWRPEGEKEETLGDAS